MLRRKMKDGRLRTTAASIGMQRSYPRSSAPSAVETTAWRRLRFRLQLPTCHSPLATPCSPLPAMHWCMNHPEAGIRPSTMQNLRCFRENARKRNQNEIRDHRRNPRSKLRCGIACESAFNFAIARPHSLALRASCLTRVQKKPGDGVPVSILSPSCLHPVSILSPSCLHPAFVLPSSCLRPAFVLPSSCLRPARGKPPKTRGIVDFRHAKKEFQRQDAAMRMGRPKVGLCIRPRRMLRYGQHVYQPPHLQ